MKKNRIIFILFLLPLSTMAQQRIEVSEDFTTVIFFPDAITESIIGNNQEYLIKPGENNSDIGKRTLRIGYVKVDKVEKNTNLTIITKDGNTYEFLLFYAKAPKKLTYYIKTNLSTANLLDSYEGTNNKTEAKPLVSYYTEGVETADAENGSNIAITDTANSGSYESDRTAYIEKVCKSTIDTPKKIYKTYDKAGNVKLTLKQVSYDRDQLYFHLRFENKGGQTYDVDFINSSLGTAYKGSSTNQTIPLTPVMVYNRPERVKGKSDADFIMVFNKFSINDNKELLIDLAEKEGERDLLLHIENRLVNNPVKL